MQTILSLILMGIFGLNSGEEVSSEQQRSIAPVLEINAVKQEFFLFCESNIKQF